VPSVRLPFHDQRRGQYAPGRSRAGHPGQCATERLLLGELREYAERPADWLTGPATEWDKRLAAIKRIAESG